MLSNCSLFRLWMLVGYNLVIFFILLFPHVISKLHILEDYCKTKIYLWNLRIYVLHPNERAVFFRTYSFVCFTSILFLMCYNCDEIYAPSPHTLPPLKGKVAQSCPTLCDLMDYAVHGILQARILEWVAFPFSRGSSLPRDWIQISCTAGGFFTSWASRETPTPNPRQIVNLCILLWRSIFPSWVSCLGIAGLGHFIFTVRIISL